MMSIIQSNQYMLATNNFKKKVKLACVKVVASAMANGTLTTRASVFASNVFPVLKDKEGHWKVYLEAR